MDDDVCSVDAEPVINQIRIAEVVRQVGRRACPGSRRPRRAGAPPCPGSRLLLPPAGRAVFALEELFAFEPDASSEFPPVGSVAELQAYVAYLVATTIPTDDNVKAVLDGLGQPRYPRPAVGAGWSTRRVDGGKGGVVHGSQVLTADEP